MKIQSGVDDDYYARSLAKPVCAPATTHINPYIYIYLFIAIDILSLSRHRRRRRRPRSIFGPLLPPADSRPPTQSPSVGRRR